MSSRERSWKTRIASSVTAIALGLCCTQAAVAGVLERGMEEAAEADIGGPVVAWLILQQTGVWHKPADAAMGTVPNTSGTIVAGPAVAAVASAAVVPPLAASGWLLGESQSIYVNPPPAKLLRPPRCSA